MDVPYSNQDIQDWWGFEVVFLTWGEVHTRSSAIRKRFWVSQGLYYDVNKVKLKQERLWGIDNKSQRDSKTLPSPLSLAAPVLDSLFPLVQYKYKEKLCRRHHSESLICQFRRTSRSTKSSRNSLRPVDPLPTSWELYLYSQGPKV